MKRSGQTILEFTAGMIALCVIVYGLVAVLRWGLIDMAERRFDHDHSFQDPSLTTEQQLNPDFHQVRPMDAMIFNKP